MVYYLSKAKGSNKLQLIRNYGVWALHFKRRLKYSQNFDLIIYGKSENPEIKLLTLRVQINVLE